MKLAKTMTLLLLTAVMLNTPGQATSCPECLDRAAPTPTITPVPPATPVAPAPETDKPA